MLNSSPALALTPACSPFSSSPPHGGLHGGAGQDGETGGEGLAGVQASACVATTRLPKQAEACTPATPPPLSGFLTMLDHTLCAADFALRKGFAAARANLGMFQS